MEKEQYTHVRHEFNPVFDSTSRILILGTLPSVKSREQNFYYGHPQNRFWKLLARICESKKVPDTIEEKKAFLLSHGIALWDVIASCEITGSADSSIKNAVANDLSPIFAEAAIKHIFVNGQTAKRFYDRYTKPLIGREAEVLPSTSPANAAWSFEKLVTAWQVLRDC